MSRGYRTKNLKQSLRLRAEAELDRRRREREKQSANPESFKQYVTRVSPGYQWYKHCEVLAAALQRVADGEVKRLMIFLPPRHSKSESISRLFTAYFVHRYPDRWVGLTCHTAELAYTLSRNARDNYQRGGGRFHDRSSAVKHWETGKGGGLGLQVLAGRSRAKVFISELSTMFFRKTSS